jgi:hypothetical protein
LLQTQKSTTDARSNQERTKESDHAAGYCQIACRPFFALRWRTVIWFGIKRGVCSLFFLLGAFVPRSTIALNARAGEQQKHGGGSPWLRALCPFCVTQKRRAREKEARHQLRERRNILSCHTKQKAPHLIEQAGNLCPNGSALLSATMREWGEK